MSAVSPAAPAADAAALYERHRTRVLRFCQSRLGSREDAEDATQTTFANAVTALRRGTVPRAEAAWLLRIAENVCHRRHRVAARRGERTCDPGRLAESVGAAPGRPDELIHLAAALATVPERQRRALLLREWQGLSYDEIAAELGLSHSAVETLLFRARRSLARALDRDGRRGGHGLAALLASVKGAVGVGSAVKGAALVVAAAGVAALPPPEELSRPTAPTARPAALPARTPAPPAAAAPAADAPVPRIPRVQAAARPAPVATRGTRPASDTAAPGPAPAPAPAPDAPAPAAGRAPELRPPEPTDGGRPLVPPIVVVDAAPPLAVAPPLPVEGASAAVVEPIVEPIAALPESPRPPEVTLPELPRPAGAVPEPTRVLG